MNYRSTTAFVIIVSFLLTAVSCGKYEEGPGFSLIPKESRLAGEWQSTKLVDIEDDEDTTYTSLIYEFDSDNNWVQRSTQSSFSLNGTWEFSDDKKFLYTEYTFSFGGSSQTYIDTSLILRLKNSELWLADQDREEREIHFEKQ
jgi:hypothetical protein